MAENLTQEDRLDEEQQRLLLSVRSKDRKATAEFVSRCADLAYPFVSHRLMPRKDAVEDLMQEILLAAWQGLPGFRGDSSLRSWILGIARHKVEDYYRKRLRAQEATDIDLCIDDDHDNSVSVIPEFEESIDSLAQFERVQKTLALLPEAYSLALLWRYRDERSLREMAELTGKTEKAIERLLARARESFRRRWNDDKSQL
jgi:RNA polymerase sigma-70 factor (ECF subfamily)